MNAAASTTRIPLRSSYIAPRPSASDPATLWRRRRRREARITGAARTPVATDVVLERLQPDPGKAAAAVVYPCPTVAAGAADEIINGAGRM
jgi:hypothetical protein